MKKTMAILLVTVLVGASLTAIAQTQKELNNQLKNAIILYNIEKVKKCIDAGADVNHRFDWGVNRDWTPLILAVRLGDADVGKVLIDAGADVNIKESGDVTLLHLAGLCPAHDRAKAVTELLIAYDLDVNAKCTTAKNVEIQGFTPLHVAASKGHVGMAEVLIKGGADVNAQVSRNHYTPLHTAVRDGHKEMAELLIEKGAEVNAKTKYGETLLYLAISKGNEELADLFRSEQQREGAKAETGKAIITFQDGTQISASDVRFEYEAPGTYVGNRQTSTESIIYICVTSGGVEIQKYFELFRVESIDFALKEGSTHSLDKIVITLWDGSKIILKLGEWVTEISPTGEETKYGYVGPFFKLDRSLPERYWGCLYISANSIVEGQTGVIRARYWEFKKIKFVK